MNINEIARKLRELAEENPNLAIDEARKLDNNINKRILKSAILIDAGSEIKDADAISEGVKIIRDIMGMSEANVNLIYNLGNGLHALSSCSINDNPDWYLNTHNFRQEARYLFNLVRFTKSVEPEIQTQAVTNFGNLLNSSFRWVEAYDAYMDALKIEPNNGVASSGAIKILEQCLRIGIGDENTIKSEINRLATITRNSKNTIIKFAGSKAFNHIEGRIREYHDHKDKEVDKPKDLYENFVLDNNLTLSPTIKGVNLDVKRWDNLKIQSLIEPVETDYRIPVIFAMFNVMKADYILARLLLFKSMHEEIQDTGSYDDTLDYACYGTKYSLLALAQRSALDLLDRIAVATLDYLKIGGAKKAHFKKAWFSETNEQIKWKDRVKALIISGNTPLIALSEIALDLLGEGGFLKAKSDARNASTHRFSIFHDLGFSHSRTSDCVEHYNLEDFKSEAIQTLKLARSSLIYFVEMIQKNEARLVSQNDGIIAPVYIPSHHYIRGKD